MLEREVVNGLYWSICGVEAAVVDVILLRAGAWEFVKSRDDLRPFLKSADPKWIPKNEEDRWCDEHERLCKAQHVLEEVFEATVDESARWAVLVDRHNGTRITDPTAIRSRIVSAAWKAYREAGKVVPDAKRSTSYKQKYDYILEPLWEIRDIIASLDTMTLLDAAIPEATALAQNPAAPASSAVARYTAEHYWSKYGIPADRLAAARRDKRLRGAKKVEGRWQYPFSEVHRLWPQDIDPEPAESR